MLYLQKGKKHDCKKNRNCILSQVAMSYRNFSTGLSSKVYQNQKSVFEKLLVKKTVRIQANEIGVDH